MSNWRRVRDMHISKGRRIRGTRMSHGRRTREIHKRAPRASANGSWPGTSTRAHSGYAYVQWPGTSKSTRAHTGYAYAQWPARRAHARQLPRDELERAVEGGLVRGVVGHERDQEPVRRAQHALPRAQLRPVRARGEGVSDGGHQLLHDAVRAEVAEEHLARTARDGLRRPCPAAATAAARCSRQRGRRRGRARVGCCRRQRLQLQLPRDARGRRGAGLRTCPRLGGLWRVGGGGRGGGRQVATRRPPDDARVRESLDDRHGGRRRVRRGGRLAREPQLCLLREALQGEHVTHDRVVRGHVPRAREQLHATQRLQRLAHLRSKSHQIRIKSNQARRSAPRAARGPASTCA